MPELHLPFRTIAHLNGVIIRPCRFALAEEIEELLNHALIELAAFDICRYCISIIWSGVLEQYDLAPVSSHLQQFMDDLAVAGASTIVPMEIELCYSVCHFILLHSVNDNLVQTLSALYKELFHDADTRFPKVPLKAICSKIGSGATPKGGKTAYIDNGISLIRSTNVFDFSFEYSDLAHINQNQADALANVVVEPNDVLFNITGVSVARCCMVPNDVLPARVNQHVMIVRPSDGEIMSYYIMFTLCTAENKAKLLGIGQSGSTREAINKQELETFEIPLPNDVTLSRFGKQAKLLYEHIHSNVKEIHALEDMKSVLLTQLSSC